uniref:Condensin complex subunit 2 n=1 Tax=Anopheles culicifacies TaxID=139723 RepID=A0A182MED7_9DIPT
MTSTSTPLRKSDASRLFRTPQSVVREVANDDEAERRSRRSEVSMNDTSSSALENENINMCLKLYSDNKMSKENAWSLTIIDSFAALMARHSKSLQNFQVAGSTLEASTKVYGLRVDSVHTDVMRMCSELTRQTAMAMNSNPEQQNEDGADEHGSDQSMAQGVDGNNKENNQTINAQPKVKKKRARNVVSTVTKSKEAINGALDTNPFMDPFFAKLNSVVGDVNSSSRLMQNIVPTKNADLRLSMDYPFWDALQSPELDLDGASETYDGLECSTLRFFPLGPGNLLRSLRSGYLITDAPAEDDEDDDDRTSLDAHMDDVEAREHGALQVNRSALEVHFDINAELEPVPSGDAFILDYEAKDIDGNDDFAEDDQMALEQCKGLQRKTVVIEDMRPLESLCPQLDYSYRPLDRISQFWAGPSHWKFKRTFRPRTTMFASDATSTAATSSKERVQRKKRFELDTLDDVLSVNETLFQVYNPNRPNKGFTHLKSAICKKWESKKLKLPTDYHLDPNRFDIYKYGRGKSVLDLCRVDVSNHAPSEEYNSDARDDQTSCNDINDGGDNDMLMNPDDGDLHPMDRDDRPLEPGEKDKTINTSTVMDAISSEFQGAPDRVNKINIAYAKTAKVIDMKQLKYNCWRLINSHVQVEIGPPPTQNPSQQDESSMPPPSQTQSDVGKITFTTLYRKVPQLLSKTMNENISKSLAFYAVLHLANEKSLVLEQQEDLKDFTIRKANV